MDDESGELMGEVPLVKDWVSRNWIDLCMVDGEKLGVDSRDEGNILEGTICYL